MNSSLFKYLDLQEDLDLSHNAISHLSLISSTPSLRSLNLAHNNINDIRSVTNPTLKDFFNLKAA